MSWRQRLNRWFSRLGPRRTQFRDDPVSVLADPDPRRRWETAAALGNVRAEQDEIMTLVASLADREPFVRWQAGDSLAALGSRAALDPLMDALRTPPPIRQASAAESLGGLGDPRAIPVLLEAAATGHVGVRTSAIEALGSISAVEAVPLLLQALRDEQAAVRRAAAWSLGTIKNSDAIDGLLVRVNDEQEHVLVRRTAAWAVGNMKLDQPEALTLAKGLNASDAQVRWQVARGLLRNSHSAGQQLIVESLAKHVDDSGRALHGTVGKEATRALKRIQSRSRWQRLLSLGRIRTQVQKG